MIPRLAPEDESLPILRMARVCDGEKVEHDVANTATGVLCFRIMVSHMRGGCVFMPVTFTVTFMVSGLARLCAQDPVE